ncbi:MAG: hypothetical protein V1876_00105 [Candidatus Peregrinibacteria bacterium]
MGTLRVNGETFDLPPALSGDRTVFTARMREKQIVNVSIRGATFTFDHPVMKHMLCRLEMPEEGSLSDIVEQSLAAVHEDLRNAVRP